MYTYYVLHRKREKKKKRRERTDHKEYQLKLQDANSDILY